MRAGVKRGGSVGFLLAALTAPGCGAPEDSCFVSGTLIATPEGQRPIESLEVGELVWSYDRAVGLVARVVQGVSRSLARVVCRVEIGDARIRGVTPSHPMFDAALDKYTALRDLSPRSRLLLFQDSGAHALPIDRLEIEEAPEPIVPVFNLSVEGPEHNYIADGVLVHNKSPVLPPPTGFCGDGHWEQWYEECDDGNRIDGDDCSNDCKAFQIGGQACTAADCCPAAQNIQVPEHCLNGVEFVDPGLERIVRAAVAQPDGKLSYEHVSGLRVLRAADEPIADLSGLECLTGLRVVDFSNGLIADLEPLSGLFLLAELHLATQRVEDVRPLAGLCLVWWLSLSNNEISDISPLSTLTSLNTVELDNNRIVEPAPLAVLPGLMWVHLSGNLIGDTAGLAGLGAWSVDLSHNPLSNLEPLTRTTAMDSLFINGTGQADLRGLAELKGLRALSAQGNGISDLSFLDTWNPEAWSGLSFLDLQNNLIVDVTPLVQLPVLGERLQVYLQGNPIDCAAQAANLQALWEGQTIYGAYTDCP